MPTPTKGQQDLFLRGDGTWSEAYTEEDEARVEALEEEIKTLKEKTIAEIAQEVLEAALIPADANLTTLAEIAQWIQNAATRLTEVEKTVVIVQSDIGTLEQTVAQNTEEIRLIQVKVGDLSTSITNITSTVNDHASAIENLQSVTAQVVKTVDTITSPDTTPFVLQTIYQAEIGTLENMNKHTSSGSVVDEINYINQCIHWSNI